MNKKIIISTIALSLLAASCNPFGGGSSSSSGIVKTTNGGVDWQFVNKLELENEKTGSFANADIGPILIYRSNPNHIYAASYNRGLLKSTNGGETWKAILTKIAVHDVAVDPSDEQKIYAAGTVSSFGRVLVTTDGGKSWQDTFTESAVDNPVKKITLNPNNSSEMIIGTQGGSVIKSIDNGKSWTLLKNFDTRLQTLSWNSDGKLMVLLRDKGLMVSSDGGATFSDATKFLTDNNSTLDFDSLPDDFFQLSTGSGNLLVITTEKGPFKTTDGGTTWTRMKIPTTAEKINTRPIAVAPSSDSIIYTAAGRTVYKSTDSGESFQTQGIATGGFINYIVVDPDRPQVAYAGIVSE